MKHLTLRNFLIAICLSSILYSCKHKDADILLINGKVYTLNAKDEVAQAIAIKGGKILEVGTTDNLMFDYSASQTIDLKGKSVYPGFIDAHCHFVGYAKTLAEIDLTGVNSEKELINRCLAHKDSSSNGWIIGRGWDQNLWKNNTLPDNTLLNKAFPDQPVFLRRIDGHAALLNAKALQLCGISKDSKIPGGKIGKLNYELLSGMLWDNAVDSASKKIPELSVKALSNLLQQAEQTCFKAGLTTLDDAGLEKDEILLLDSLQQSGVLSIQVYAMASPSEENITYFLEKGKPYKTDKIHVRSIKLYADGALGSRGAALLESYTDAPDNHGYILHPPAYYQEIAQKVYEKGFQLNTHCIGDSANRMISRIYGKVLGAQNDRRWRIEHAQVVHPKDMDKFKQYNIWPSVQPYHAISDMKWVKERLGKKRLSTAYAYNSLWEQNHRIAFGSDFPVEAINPILSFYAAVARVDTLGLPIGGFLKEEAVSRKTALKAMTIWAAEANFEENEKGSIERGKNADLVVLDSDLLLVPESEIPHTKVCMTFLNGEIAWDTEK